MGRLSFTTCDPVALPPRLPSSDNWLERARVGASSLGNMFPHMLASKVAFFLSIASNSIASHIINAAKQRDTGEWLAAAKLHSKTQLHRFQMHPLAEWHREDLQLALSWLGEAMRPATQRLIEMGVDGWLLEVVDDQVLEVRHTIQALPRLLIMRWPKCPVLPSAP